MIPVEESTKNSFNVDKNKSTKRTKVRIRRCDLERCIKEYGLKEEDFEFEDEERIKMVQEHIMKSIKEGHDHRILDLV